LTRGAKRAGGTKENEEVTQKRTRFILAFACLAILALAALYQLQIQQSADSQGIAWENTRANAQENTLAAPSSSTEGSLTPSTSSEPSASLAIPDASQSVESPAAALDTSLTARELPASVRLEVPLIMQLPELPTGC
jgi:hypothetical protein